MIFSRAFVKVGIGAEKKSHIISEKEKKITAYHEAGHAILFHVLPDVGPVYSVSIIPTGWSRRLYNAASGTVMRCIIQRERCYRILRYRLADV